MLAPRFIAAALLLLPLGAIFPLAKFVARRSRQPAVHWLSACYMAWLHLIWLYGLLSSTRFEDALSLLTLFTFPASGIVSSVIRNEGFSTLPDLAINYVRYILCFGGTDALVFAVFLSLVLPRRVPKAHLQVAEPLHR